MNEINVLDCTLRDGGYCNQWKFGYNEIKTIINRLIETGVQIIECGFLTERVKYVKDITKFSSIEQINNILLPNRENKLFVCMINYGEYAIKNLPARKDSCLDGIRVAFHKKDMVEALAFCEEIVQKGYKVFIQPMMTMNYREEEFLTLIHLANKVKPYAFYIVDSFGVMKRKDLSYYYEIADKNLNNNIQLGFHCHNNLQLAYSNAQFFVEKKGSHNKIVDSSVLGMGRGAGNLNTELFVEYLNDYFSAEYNLKPLLIIIDEILNRFYEQNYWGYSLPNYLSAKHKAHPNYASYLDAKKTLTVECMDEIFMMMSAEKKLEFDKNYIEDLYIKYMTNGQTQNCIFAELSSRVKEKEVLLIAPGKSSIDEKDKIIEYAKRKNILTISINFDYKECDTDFIFLSNLRRFKELDALKNPKCIVTSNIPMENAYLKVKYENYLNDMEFVRDNAGLMAIAFLISIGVKKIYLAGLDGYSVDPTKNFIEPQMNIYTKKNNFELMNKGLKEVLIDYKKNVDIEFLTKPQYININE